MRVSVARTALAAAGLAVIGLVGSASAGATPVGAKPLIVTDAAADSLGQPGDDIVQVTYNTAGTGSGKSYKPTSLTMSIKVKGAISTNGFLAYEFAGSIAGCGEFYIDLAPGAELGDVVGTSCADDDAADLSAGDLVIAGDTLTYTLPLSAFPGAKAGSKLDAAAVYTGSTDPVIGFAGPVPGFGITDLANDEAVAAASYTVA